MTLPNSQHQGSVFKGMVFASRGWPKLPTKLWQASGAKSKVQRGNLVDVVYHNHVHWTYSND